MKTNDNFMTCPNCGADLPIVRVHRLGRKPSNIGVNNVCDALQNSSTVTEASIKLKCSRGYVYKILKEFGMSPKTLTKEVHSVK